MVDLCLRVYQNEAKFNIILFSVFYWAKKKKRDDKEIFSNRLKAKG